MAPARKKPTLEDLDALPRDVKGEIIDGVLYTMARPRARHQWLVLEIGRAVGNVFGRTRSSPGGWWILPEPGIELANTPEIAPDLGGWRRERLATLSDLEPIRELPDWVCEILSPSARRHDVLVKKPYYARAGVSFHWLVDPDARTITACRLEHGRWLEVGVYGDEVDARIEPFDTAPLDIASFWPEPA